MTVRPSSRQPVANTRSFITIHGGEPSLLFGEFFSAVNGECISVAKTPREKGKEHFLFPLGESHFYVSKFKL